MKKIELEKLFNITYGTKLNANKVTISDKNDIIYVSRTAKNHGIKGKVARLTCIKPNNPGTITVPLGGEGRLTACLQFSHYYNGQNIAILTPKNHMTEEELLYYSIVVRKNQYRYSAFGREANVTLKDILIPDIKSIPSYVYSTRYSESLSKNVYLQDSKLYYKKIAYKKVNILDVFDILPNEGTSVKLEDAIKYEAGDIAVVSSSERNNGVNAFVKVSSTQGYKIYPENCITLAKNGSVGVTFFHENKIIATTDVYILKYKFELINKWIGLYYKALIEKNKFKFNYGRKINNDRLNEINFLVPVDNKGNIDHSYIEKLMTSKQITKLIN